MLTYTQKLTALQLLYKEYIIKKYPLCLILNYTITTDLMKYYIKGIINQRVSMQSELTKHRVKMSPYIEYPISSIFPNISHPKYKRSYFLVNSLINERANALKSGYVLKNPYQTS